MSRFYCNYDKKKIILNIITCLTCMFIALVAIFTINFYTHLKSKSCMVYTEISKINQTELHDVETSGISRVAITDYSELSYYIKVNCAEQVVSVYTQDEDGNYNVLVKNMICSTGKDTPKAGVFSISNKYEWRELVGRVYGQYATRITGAILFHSVPYTRKSKSSLEYWEYDKLGEPASKGCVRLTVEDSKWIYDYCKPGTMVEFCTENDNNLADWSTKATKMKLSEYDDELRKWDPTDPDENNPWLNLQ